MMAWWWPIPGRSCCFPLRLQSTRTPFFQNKSNQLGIKNYSPRQQRGYFLPGRCKWSRLGVLCRWIGESRWDSQGPKRHSCRCCSRRHGRQPSSWEWRWRRLLSPQSHHLGVAQAEDCQLSYYFNYTQGEPARKKNFLRGNTNVAVTVEEGELSAPAAVTVLTEYS